jgi:polyisoprenoid-binding protein YceI
MKRLAIILVGILCITINVDAESLTFSIKGGEGNQIRFESKAPLETIIGKTDQVSGSITVDLQNLEAGVSADIVVNAASIKTGNKIRDGHMRGNHLHTDQHPNIQFRFDNLSLKGALVPNVTLKCQVTGEFSLHGVTKNITVPSEVTLKEVGAGKELHIVANFEVKLADYEIPRPQFLIMKLDEVQRITVDIQGVKQ